MMETSYKGAREPAELKTVFDRLVAELISYLGSVGFFGEKAAVFSPTQFGAFAEQVYRSFQVPNTSITTAAARLFYGLAESIKPSVVVGLGTFYGNGLIWFLGPCMNDRTGYSCRTFACDLDGTAVRGCRENLRRLGLSSDVSIQQCDAFDLLISVEDKIDLLFIDVDHPVQRKKIYAPLILQALNKLAPGALVVAHDRLEPTFTNDFAAYLTVVNDKRYFNLSAAVPVDAAGLELSRRC